MEQELLNQVCGDLVSTCESYISNIVLKEDGAGQLQEDLLVSLGIIVLNYPLPRLFKGCRCAWSWCSSKSMPRTGIMGMCKACLCDEFLYLKAWEPTAVSHTSSCFKDVAPHVFLIYDVLGFFPFAFSTQTSQLSCLGERFVKGMECFEGYFSLIRCGGKVLEDIKHTHPGFLFQSLPFCSPATALNVLRGFGVVFGEEPTPAGLICSSVL